MSVDQYSLQVKKAVRRKILRGKKNYCAKLAQAHTHDIGGRWLGCLLFCWLVAVGWWHEFGELPLPNLARDLAQTCVGFGPLLGAWGKSIHI